MGAQKSGNGPSTVDRGSGPDLSRGELSKLAESDRATTQRNAAAPPPTGYGVLDGKISRTETVGTDQRTAQISLEHGVQPGVEASAGRLGRVDIAASHPSQTTQVDLVSEFHQRSRSKPSDSPAPFRGRRPPSHIEEHKGSGEPSLSGTVSGPPTTGFEYSLGDRSSHKSSPGARPHTPQQTSDVETSTSAPTQPRQPAQNASETAELRSAESHQQSEPTTLHAGPTTGLPTSPDVTAAQHLPPHPTSGNTFTPTGNERALSDSMAREAGSMEISQPYPTPESNSGLYPTASTEVRSAEPATTYVGSREESGQIREQLPSPETTRVVDDPQAQEASFVFAIEGRVINRATGSPIMGAVINGGLLGIQYTDLMGGFCFDNVPVGTGYSCHASKRGLSFKPSVTNGVVSGPMWIEFEAED